MILVVSGVRIINGTMSIGEYTIIGTYFAVLFKTLKSMMSLFKSYQDAKASWDRTAIATREKERSGWNRTDLAKLDEINDISVSDLEFSVALPDGSVREVLGGFSFKFSGPGTYCIVGENGRGKTSLLYLMLGLYSSKGKVNTTACQSKNATWITYVRERYRAAHSCASRRTKR